MPAAPLETIALTIRNRLEDLPLVTSLLDELGERHQLPPDALSLNLALDEILSNTVKYAYAEGTEHAIWIRLTVGSDAIEAVVEDEGVPFDPLGAEAPREARSLADFKVGGEGIRLVRRLMSEVRYARAGNRNRLTLVKRFAPPP